MVCDSGKSTTFLERIRYDHSFPEGGFFMSIVYGQLKEIIKENDIQNVGDIPLKRKFQRYDLGNARSRNVCITRYPFYYIAQIGIIRHFIVKMVISVYY